jgi:hypothetical protein
MGNVCPLGITYSVAVWFGVERAGLRARIAVLCTPRQKIERHDSIMKHTAREHEIPSERR